MAGMKHGTWCHIEIPTASAETAKKFYGQAFGWTFHEIPEHKYTTYRTGDGEIGGGLFDPPAGAPRTITNYILVDDLEASAKKVQELGGRIVADRVEVPGMGWFRIIADPDGNTFGLWQSMQQPKPESGKKPAQPAKAAKKSKGRKGRK